MIITDYLLYTKYKKIVVQYTRVSANQARPFWPFSSVPLVDYCSKIIKHIARNEEIYIVKILPATAFGLLKFY